jgi:glycosyltransferase involved in cell wall biosynthesis
LVIVFQNLFGHGYEGGANWLEVSLYSLGLLQQPPHCIVLGATRDILPLSIRDAAHVEAIPLDVVGQSGTTRVLDSLTRRITRQPWESPALKKIAEQYKVDLWIGFSGFEGLGPQRRLLVWYPDFQFRHVPEVFSEQEILERSRQWKFVAQRADGILAISQAVASDALESDPQVKEKLFVCGFPPVFPRSLLDASPDEIRKKYDLPEQFFLVCNQFFKHKNHLTVLQALRQLRDDGQSIPVVAFTGRPHDYRNPDAFSDLLQFVNVHKLHHYCRFLGVVPRKDQVALIRASQAVIHPSKFEGRGAIVEEAFILGTQVICSDLPVHRELRAPGTFFFPVGDVSEVARLMQGQFRPSNKTVDEIVADSKRWATTYGEELMLVCTKLINGQTHGTAAV